MKYKTCGHVTPAIAWRLDVKDNEYKPWNRCPQCRKIMGRSTHKGKAPPLPSQREFNFSDHSEEYV